MHGLTSSTCWRFRRLKYQTLGRALAIIGAFFAWRRNLESQLKDQDNSRCHLAGRIFWRDRALLAGYAHPVVELR
jgi:hypothetical protein